MSAEFIFQSATVIAMLGWFILLFISPFWFRADRFITGIIIALLALIYTWLLIDKFDFSDLGKFTSARGVSALFSNKYLLTAGWVHYLAIDLLAGTWIKKNSFKHGIPFWQVFICLLLTLLFGPVGIMVYLLLRTARTKEYFSENF